MVNNEKGLHQTGVVQYTDSSMDVDYSDGSHTHYFRPNQHGDRMSTHINPNSLFENRPKRPVKFPLKKPSGNA